MRRVCASLLCLSAVSLAAQARATEPTLLWAVNDNDFWAFRGTDVDYSNGLELHLRLPLQPRYGARWLQLGVSLGHAIFSPPNLRETDPEVLRQDRPYAGWLWSSLQLDSAWSTTRFRLEVRGGVVGPHAFGEEAQRAWHSTNRAPDPKGWGIAQVGDTPDLGARLALNERLVRLDLARLGDGWMAADFGPEVSCEVGLLRVRCAAGALLRFGLLREAARSSVGTLTVPIEPPANQADGALPREIFLFLGAEGRVTPRDQLLDGSVCGTDGCGRSWVSRVPWGSEAQVGLAFTHSGWFAFFSRLWRSPELSAPVGAKRSQQFGRVVIGKAW